MSARAELRFAVARRLGLEPRSLLDDSEPRFLWRSEARFKHGRASNGLEQAGIISFGRAVTAALLSATPPSGPSLVGVPAGVLRGQLLRSTERPFVDLSALLVLAWSSGVPVVHLQVHPWAAKRMAAMTAGVNGRAGVLLAKNSPFPAVIAFYVAHEIGHIALGHTEDDDAIVDLDTDSMTPLLTAEADADERDADGYALELLTGRREFDVFADDSRAQVSGAAVAAAALQRAGDLRIDPGTLALGFGQSTGQWAVATAALRRIYGDPPPVGHGINVIASDQLQLEDIPLDAADFLTAVMGVSG